MDQPFRLLHESYKLAYEKAEAHAKAEQERQKKEEEERQAEAKKNHKKVPYQIQRQSSDVKIDNYTPSPMDAEAFEEAMEEFAEGGVI